MRDLHENALLEEVKEWLPPGWVALGRNSNKWGSIRFQDREGKIRGRLKCMRGPLEWKDAGAKLVRHYPGSLTVIGTIVKRRPSPCKGSYDVEAATWDLLEPDSVDNMETWVRREIFCGEA